MTTNINVSQQECCIGPQTLTKFVRIHDSSPGAYYIENLSRSLQVNPDNGQLSFNPNINISFPGAISFHSETFDRYSRDLDETYNYSEKNDGGTRLTLTGDNGAVSPTDFADMRQWFVTPGDFTLFIVTEKWFNAGSITGIPAPNLGLLGDNVEDVVIILPPINKIKAQSYKIYNRNSLQSDASSKNVWIFPYGCWKYTSDDDLQNDGVDVASTNPANTTVNIFELEDTPANGVKLTATNTVSIINDGEYRWRVD